MSGQVAKVTANLRLSPDEFYIQVPRKQMSRETECSSITLVLLLRLL